MFRCASPLYEMRGSESLRDMRLFVKEKLLIDLVVLSFSIDSQPRQISLTSLSAFSIICTKTCPSHNSMNENHARLSPALVETIAGLTAGVASTLAAHPLDVIKTRLQSQFPIELFLDSLDVLTFLSPP